MITLFPLIINVFKSTFLNLTNRFFDVIKNIDIEEKVSQFFYIPTENCSRNPSTGSGPVKWFRGLSNCHDVPHPSRLRCVCTEEPEGGRRKRAPLRASVEKLRPQLEAYENLCQELGQTPADVALAWVLHNPAVTSPIIGPRTLEQLEQSVKALELILSKETLSKLDEIWPGPGNQAPEAYAW